MLQLDWGPVPEGRVKVKHFHCPGVFGFLQMLEEWLNPTSAAFWDEHAAGKLASVSNGCDQEKSLGLESFGHLAQ